MRKFLSAVAMAAGMTLLPATQAAAYTISLYDASPMTNLTQAYAAIAGSPTVVFQNSIIEFDDLGDPTRGLFGINNPWGITPPDTFAARITGTIELAGGSFTFGMNHDDGARLLIDGNIVATADGVADNRTTTFTGNFAAGLHSVEIIYFENGGGASLEFFGRQSSTAPWELIQSVPEPGSLALVGLSLLGLGASRRRRR